METYTYIIIFLAVLFVIWNLWRITILFVIRQKLYAIRDELNTLLVSKELNKEDDDVKQLVELIACIKVTLGKIGIIRLGVMMSAPRNGENDKFKYSDISSDIVKKMYLESCLLFFLSVMGSSFLTIPLASVGLVISLSKHMQRHLQRIADNFADALCWPSKVQHQLCKC